MERGRLEGRGAMRERGRLKGRGAVRERERKEAVREME